MASESEPGEEDVQRSGPAQSFEDLRAEIAELRQAVESLPETLEQNWPIPPPDYGEDLGRIVHQLTVVAGRLDGIEKHPALRLTPEQHRQAMVNAGDVLMRNAIQKLDEATQEAGIERDRLARLIGVVRRRGEQRYWLLGTGLAALIFGLLLAPLVASVLPYGMNSRVAALVMKADRWNAGMALMEMGNPEAWRSVVESTELVRVNQDALKTCRQAAAKTKKEQRCTVNVPAK